MPTYLWDDARPFVAQGNVVIYMNGSIVGWARSIRIADEELRSEPVKVINSTAPVDIAVGDYSGGRLTIETVFLNSGKIGASQGLKLKTINGVDTISGIPKKALDLIYQSVFDIEVRIFNPEKGSNKPRIGTQNIKNEKGWILSDRYELCKIVSISRDGFSLGQLIVTSSINVVYGRKVV